MPSKEEEMIELLNVVLKLQEAGKGITTTLHSMVEVAVAADQNMIEIPITVASAIASTISIMDTLIVKLIEESATRSDLMEHLVKKHTPEGT